MFGIFKKKPEIKEKVQRSAASGSEPASDNNLESTLKQRVEEIKQDKNAYERLANDTFPGLTMYVRDVNLPKECAIKYSTGMIIKERGFTDASRRVMGMITSYRYSILSNHMADLSAFEHGTNWGLCVGQAGSHFKVLDIYEFRGKTQILLLHLPDDERWKMFEDLSFSIEEQLIQTSRQRFENKAFSDPIPELTSAAWLDRCKEPLGMFADGTLFDL